MKIGLQLYSVRDKMAEDMEGTLKAVAEMGYDYVEFAGYFDRSAEEIREMLDNYGLEAVSAHQGNELFLEKGQEGVDYLKKIGVSYVAVPWMPEEKHKGGPGFEEAMKEFAYVAELLKKNGVGYLYHNHDWELNKYEGKTLIDWLYENFSAEDLQAEFDTCWIRYSGYDPCEYLKKYAGRCPIVHLKDFTCKEFGAGPVYDLIDGDGNTKNESKEDKGFRFRPVGYGIQDFKAILKAAEEAGAEIAIVEQDDWYDADPLEEARKGREYLKSIGY